MKSQKIKNLSLSMFLIIFLGPNVAAMNPSVQSLANTTLNGLRNSWKFLFGEEVTNDGNFELNRTDLSTEELQKHQEMFEYENERLLNIFEMIRRINIDLTHEESVKKSILAIQEVDLQASIKAEQYLEYLMLFDEKAEIVERNLDLLNKIAGRIEQLQKLYKHSTATQSIVLKIIGGQEIVRYTIKKYYLPVKEGFIAKVKGNLLAKPHAFKPERRREMYAELKKPLYHEIDVSTFGKAAAAGLCYGLMLSGSQYKAEVEHNLAIAASGSRTVSPQQSQQMLNSDFQEVEHSISEQMSENQNSTIYGLVGKSNNLVSNKNNQIYTISPAHFENCEKAIVGDGLVCSKMDGDSKYVECSFDKSGNVRLLYGKPSCHIMQKSDTGRWIYKRNVCPKEQSPDKFYIELKNREAELAEIEFIDTHCLPQSTQPDTFFESLKETEYEVTHCNPSGAPKSKEAFQVCNDLDSGKGQLCCRVHDDYQTTCCLVSEDGSAKIDNIDSLEDDKQMCVSFDAVTGNPLDTQCHVDKTESVVCKKGKIDQGVEDLLEDICRATPEEEAIFQDMVRSINKFHTDFDTCELELPVIGKVEITRDNAKYLSDKLGIKSNCLTVDDFGQGRETQDVRYLYDAKKEYVAVKIDESIEQSLVKMFEDIKGKFNLIDHKKVDLKYLVEKKEDGIFKTNKAELLHSTVRFGAEVLEDGYHAFKGTVGHEVTHSNDREDCRRDGNPHCGLNPVATNVNFELAADLGSILTENKPCLMLKYAKNDAELAQSLLKHIKTLLPSERDYALDYIQEHSEIVKPLTLEIVKENAAKRMAKGDPHPAPNIRQSAQMITYFKYLAVKKYLGHKVAELNKK